MATTSMPPYFNDPLPTGVGVSVAPSSITPTLYGPVIAVSYSNGVPVTFTYTIFPPGTGTLLSLGTLATTTSSRIFSQTLTTLTSQTLVATSSSVTTSSSNSTTTSSPQPSASSGPSVGAWVGISIAIVVVLLLVGTLAFFLGLRLKKQTKETRLDQHYASPIGRHELGSGRKRKRAELSAYRHSRIKEMIDAQLNRWNSMRRYGRGGTNELPPENGVNEMATNETIAELDASEKQQPSTTVTNIQNV